jgi:hypothetical protein
MMSIELQNLSQLPGELIPTQGQHKPRKKTINGFNMCIGNLMQTATCKNEPKKELPFNHSGLFYPLPIAKISKMSLMLPDKH